MQYLSSFIVSWAPFLANPDFQIIVIAMMSIQLLHLVIKKSIKIIIAGLKISSAAAIIGMVLYLAIEQPNVKHNKSVGQKVGEVLYELKTGIPTFLADLKNSIEKNPKT